MQKKLIALAVALLGAAAGSAQAQTSVQIYGNLDAGFGYSNHTLSSSPTDGATGTYPFANAKGDKSWTGMINGARSASLLGFRGEEALGNGLKAIFGLETGFALPTGQVVDFQRTIANQGAAQTTVNGDSSLNGQLFGRQAFVGLSSATLGTIKIGRNYAFGYDILGSYDPQGLSPAFSPFGYYGGYAGGGFTQDQRLDNSVKYTYANSGFNAGAMFQFGQQAGSFQAGSEWQLTAGYDAAMWGVQAGYSKARDSLLAGPSGLTETLSNGSQIISDTLKVTAADTSALILAGKLKLNPVTLSLGYERIKTQNPSNPSYDTTADITNINGYAVSSISTTAFNNPRKQDMFFGGAKWDISSNWDLNGAVYYLRQQDYTVGGCPAVLASTCEGHSTFYSLTTDYKFSKRTSLYAGVSYNKLSDGLAVGYLNDSNTFVGTGIRHSF